MSSEKQQEDSGEGDEALNSLLSDGAEGEKKEESAAGTEGEGRGGEQPKIKRIPRRSRGHPNKKASPRRPEDHHKDIFQIESLGRFQSMFRGKFGTPRQGGLVSPSSSRASLTLRAELSPSLLDGLEEYSHVWLVFIFHGNKVKERQGCPVFTKVKPPRLGGRKVGVFACRSPHRPNPIGLSLVRLDRVEGRTLYFSGVDLVEGTPIIDIKPHHPSDHCDSLLSPSVPHHPPPPAQAAVAAGAAEMDAMKSVVSDHGCRHPRWVEPNPPLPVRFTPHAASQLRALFEFDEWGERPEFLFLRNQEEAERAIREIVACDPRSVYSRARHGRDFVYGVYIDKLEVAFVFREEGGQGSEESPFVEVVWVEFHPEDSAADLPALRTEAWSGIIRAKLATVAEKQRRAEERESQEGWN